MLGAAGAAAITATGPFILGPKPIAIEVKEVTNEEFKALGAALAKQPSSVDSALLTGRWNVVVRHDQYWMPAPRSASRAAP